MSVRGSVYLLNPQFGSPEQVASDVECSFRGRVAVKLESNGGRIVVVITALV